MPVCLYPLRADEDPRSLCRKGKLGSHQLPAAVRLCWNDLILPPEAEPAVLGIIEISPRGP
jgi:hypothetical protein